MTERLEALKRKIARVRELLSWESILRYFTGPDVFISYARDDALLYAGRLAARLHETKKLYASVDLAHTPPGREVSERIVKLVRRSTVLVVLGSPAARKSAAIKQEIEAFPSDRRPLLPVLFEEPEEAGTAARSPWWIEEIVGLPVARLPVTDLGAEIPSEDLVERIRLAVGNHRLSQRLWRAGALVATLLVLGLAALGFVLFRLSSAVQDLQAAETQAGEAWQQLAEANGRLTLVNQELASSRQELGRLRTRIDEQEKRLADATTRAAREERRADEQAEATAQLWKAIQEGMQDEYRQPDLSCREGRLELDPPLTLYFPPDETKVPDQARRLLDRMIRCYVQQEPRPPLLITAYISYLTRRPKSEGGLATDVVGSYENEHNLAFGERLVNTVREYLTNAGLPESRIRALIHGEERSQPSSLLNNRVEITFFPTGSPTSQGAPPR